MDLITQRLKLVDIYPEKAEELAKKYKKKADEFELVRKGKVSERIEVHKGERAVVNYITTGIIDRDGEIVDPKGADLKYYRDNPVVMWAHRYDQLPIGKNLWIKTDEKGLRAKTRFLDHDFADEVYRLYTEPIMDGNKDTGPAMKAWSIGFVPIEWEDLESKGKKNNAKRKYTKWELLEYSAVPIPSNPEALTVAIGKGLKLSDEMRKDLGIEIIDDDITKPETTQNYHRIPVRGEEGKHEGHKIRTITISRDQGIKALYCVDCKKIITYLFDKNKWTMEEAREWVREHGKMVIVVDGDEENEEIEIIGDDEMQTKGVIPFKETPKAPEDAPWNGPAEVREAEVSDLKIMCCWFDSENPDIKQSYKLPHHRASGQHPVVWRGVAAAMAALLGARGGVNIPSGDRKGVYNHLAKHYKQFDKEVPEFREYTEEELKEIFPEVYEKEQYECECIECGYRMMTEKHCRDVKCPECGGEMRRVERPGPGQRQVDGNLIEIVKEIKEEILELKEGRVLSAKNRELVKKCRDMLDELLRATEPPRDDGKTIEIDDTPQDTPQDDLIEVEESIIDKLLEEKLKKNNWEKLSLEELQKLRDEIAALTGKVIER